MMNHRKGTPKKFHSFWSNTPVQLVSIERRNFVGSELERAAEEATQEAETADRGEVFRACVLGSSQEHLYSYMQGTV